MDMRNNKRGNIFTHACEWILANQRRTRFRVGEGGGGGGGGDKWQFLLLLVGGKQRRSQINIFRPFWLIHFFDSA